MTLTDADYMARALFHAARGRGRTSPNPAVGAVVVSRVLAAAATRALAAGRATEMPSALRCDRSAFR